MPSPNTHIDRFAQTLSQAVSDAITERSPGLRFYCDANVVLDIIFSVSNYQFGPQPTRHDLLARALLSAGLIAKIHVLRPHLIEVDSRLRGIAQQLTERAINYREQAEAVAGQLGILTAARDLLRLAQNRVHHLSPQGEGEFLDLLRSHGADALIALDLFLGPWQHRLRILAGETLSLSTEPMASRVQRAWDGDLFSFYRILDQARPERTRNNARDAMALLELSGLNDAHLANPCAVPAVRFITHDRALMRLVNDLPALRHRFRNSDEATTSKASGVDNLTIFRSHNYLFLRAAFPALRGETTADPDLSPDLPRLLRLSHELESIRIQEPRGLARAAQHILGGMTVDELARAVEDLSFVRNAVLHPTTRKRLLRLRTEPGQEKWSFTDLRQFIGERFTRELQALERFIRDGHRNLVVLSGRANALLTASRLVAHTFSFGVNVPNFDRDFGGVRWNVATSDVSEEKWRTLIAQLMANAGEGAAESAAQAVVVALETSETLEDVSAAAVALWACGCDEIVVAVINNFDDTHEETLPASLAVLRMAARLRSGSAVSNEELLLGIGSLREEIEKAVREQPASARLFIGLAYCMFMAGGAASPSSRASLLTESICYGERARTMLLHDPLGGAFALNHVVYMSFFANIDAGVRENGLSLREDLAALREDARIWNYRFCDTLAWATFCEAREGKRERGGQMGRESVARAIVDLEGSGPTFGDLEVERHLAAMRTWCAATGSTAAEGIQPAD